MKLLVEKIENSRAYIEIALTNEEFAPFIDEAFKEEVKNVEVNGFRKGKMPKNMFIKRFGEQSLYPTAMDLALNSVYPKLVEENNLKVIDSPNFDWASVVVDAEKFEIKGDVALLPEVTVGDYDAIRETVKLKKARVTQAEIDAEVKKLLDSKSTFELKEEEAIENGDSVTFDFEGFVDGEAFEGGKAENHTLVIGSGAFIPGFEEELVGVKSGESKDVVVTFPKDYHAEDLKGKEATFKCLVHEVKKHVLPEINEELLAELEGFEATTEKKFKDEVKARISDQKNSANLQAYRQEIFTKVIEDANFEVPAEMVARETEQTLANFKQQIKAQGFDFELYLQMTGMTEDQIRADIDKESARKLQEMLVIDAVAKTLPEVSNEELDAKIDQMAAQYNMTADEVIKAIGDKTRLVDDVNYEKAYNAIIGEVN